ncbi:DNA polymerase III subunit gamma and tau [Streptomyces sp. TP-A0874]|uniref:DNA polymerase III subunit gamma and tau n=1 Tax=Streptomyces sp. TP-A0874 TaxID=549819 RepID=UPI000853D1E3|nr:DNA polymerase III subunit gamma and tau [Streptomyces sp. TP-A0874]
MSSLALYRRYRPETYAEVIGQEHVTGPLQQALRNNRVNHAYLFSGPRGCGKTTSARILARCLNCEQGPTPEPCGDCRSCRDLARNGPGSIDVIEIDAASHGGVDDARDLREKAFFGPAGSRYKIYIIDEAHMVTSAGFNALLKVVEEPPEHLKFIFATTEPEKVIGTIRSRTHHYPFRLVPPGTLRDYLAEVCEREAIPVEEGVLPLVVRAGAGSVRDSMSVMDQLLAGAAEDGVTYAMATALLGYTEGSLLDGVVEAFASGDGGAAFEVVDRVVEGGNDPRRFVTDLLERLRDLVILAAVPDAAEKGLVDAPADVLERMRAQASKFGAAELSRAADLVNQGLTEMRGATSPRLQLELICARVLLPAAFDDERSFQARLDRLERGAAAGVLAAGQGGPAGSVGPPMGYVPASDAHADHGPGPSGPAAARASLPGRGRGDGAAGASSESSGAVPAEPGPPSQRSAGGVAQGTPGDAEQPGGAAPPVRQPAPPPAPPGAGGRRPGAWPTSRTGSTATSGAPGEGPAAAGDGGTGRQPGSWPSATAPGQGAARGPEPAGPARPAASVPSPAPSSGGAGAAPGGGHGAAQVRQMWPDILEAVKNRRRFTWILLSQNAQIVGFDGSTLQIGFSNAGARDSFVSGGSEDVLRQALNDSLHVQWKIESVVDPSGGAGAGARGAGGGAPGRAQPPGPMGAPPAGAAERPAPPPARPAESGPGGAVAESPRRRAQAQQAPAERGEQYAPASEPPPYSVEDDMPNDDDPDLDESALSGPELIVRELGATVLEEIDE